MGRRMALSKVMRDEEGQAFILVLVFLLVGGLILAPLLGYMSTGVRAGQMYEEKMYALYAADAGVEDALWHLISGSLIVSEGEIVNLTQSAINNKTVNVSIEGKPDSVYKITSVATGDASSNTVIEAYVSTLDFSSFFDNGITSGGSVTFQPGSSTDGTVLEDYTGEWPTADQFSEYYLRNVDTSSPFDEGIADSIIFIQDPPWSTVGIGPLYRDGRLNIKNTGAHDLEVGLSGTVYVTGDLDIGAEGNRFVLHLNDQTIFVEGAIDIGNKVTIEGSGCVIGIGDVNFSPNIATSPGDFVFVMSVEGTTQFNPGNEFYGSVAGNVEVQMQPGSTINWRELTADEESALNFPTGAMDALEIRTWEINP